MESSERKEKAKEIIKSIVDFLNDNSDLYGYCLWNILTALRGPDNIEDEELKLITTARLRYLIGIKTPHALTSDQTLRSFRSIHDTEVSGWQGQLINSRKLNEAEEDMIKNLKWSHFKTHVKNAINAYNFIYEKSFYKNEEK